VCWPSLEASLAENLPTLPCREEVAGVVRIADPRNSGVSVVDRVDGASGCPHRHAELAGEIAADVASSRIANDELDLFAALEPACPKEISKLLC
jgi:hypothetical protein